VIVGLTTGKAIALVHEKPLIAVNHLEAHALTARLTDGAAFPYCLFLASGGHTQVVAVRGVGDYVRLGTTRDDAIGEAFDKTAKLLGLGYPGGPRVEQEATRGDPARFTLPRPMLGRRDADFSLSGLKTALRLEAEKIAPLSDQDVADLCAAFQGAVVETVADRLRHGLRMFRERFGAPTALVAAGGVAANGAIRAALVTLADEDGVALVVPPPGLCTDNGAMIAWAGAERLAHGMCDMLDTAPRARWPLAQVSKPGNEQPVTAESVTAGAPPALSNDDAKSGDEVPKVMGGALSPSPPAGEGGDLATNSESAATPPPQPSSASEGLSTEAPAKTREATLAPPDPAPPQPASDARAPVAAETASAEPTAADSAEPAASDTSTSPSAAA
jgi:N6-L-threonylcarbamoyladenine synthase